MRKNKWDEVSCRNSTGNHETHKTKTLAFLLGMLTVALTLGMTVLGCDDGSKDDDGSVPATAGKLTITGIAAEYNGKFAMAMGGTADESISLVCVKVTGPSSGEPVPIANGQVVLPVYKLNNNAPVAYTGSDAVSLMIAIYANKQDIMSDGNPIAGATVSSVQFTNGGATVSNPTITAYTPE